MCSASLRGSARGSSPPMGNPCAVRAKQKMKTWRRRFEIQFLSLSNQPSCLPKSTATILLTPPVFPQEKAGWLISNGAWLVAQFMKFNTKYTKVTEIFVEQNMFFRSFCDFFTWFFYIPWFKKTLLPLHWPGLSALTHVWCYIYQLGDGFTTGKQNRPWLTKNSVIFYSNFHCFTI